MRKKSYLSLVVEQFRQDVFEYYKDRKGWAYNIGSAILAAIITPIALFVWGQIDMNNALSSSVVAGIAAGAVIFAIWFLFVVAYYGVTAPVKLYREKESLANKFTWNDVSINIDEVSIPDTVCLEVSNHKTHDIGECGGVIIYLEKSGGVVFPDEPQGPKRCLAWRKEKGETYMTKKLSRKGQPGSTRPMVVAKQNISEKTAWIQTQDLSSQPAVSDNIPLEAGITYRIRINFLGGVDGRKMDDYARDYWITFKGNKLEMKEAK